MKLCTKIPIHGKVHIKQREKGVEYEGGGLFAVYRRGHSMGMILNRGVSDEHWCTRKSI